MPASYGDKTSVQLTLTHSTHSSPLFHYSHNYQISFASKGNLQIPIVQTISYGKDAFVYMVIKTWNDIQKEMKSVMLNTFSLVKLKSLLIEFYLNMHKTS